MATGVEIRGWDELQKKLANLNLKAPAEELLREGGKYAVEQLRKRAPKESGWLSGSNSYRVNTSGNDWTLTITNDAEHDGFRYGFALDHGTGKRKSSETGYVFHRRRTGQPTKLWFRGIRTSTRNRIRANMKKALKAIEGRWNGK